MSSFAEFEQRLSEHVPVDRALAERLFSHYELMVKWNQRLNLTRDVEVRRAVERHYAECVWFWRERPFDGTTLVDIGSGPGFPGVVIAAMAPEVRVTLVESHTRKAVFLKEATRSFGNVEVRAVRADALNEEFDLLVSRAVAWRDLAPLVPRVAAKVGLLIGEEDGTSIQQSAGIAWEASKKLPWGDRRIALWGSVPRGT